MSRYTYTLRTDRIEEPVHTYKRNDLEKMTMFHLREICRKEKLVVSSSQQDDKESLVRLIMRFRGQKEYRNIQTGCEGGLERLQEFFRDHEIQLTNRIAIRLPGTITLYHETGMNEMDNYQVQSEEKLYEGNLLLIDEIYQVYTCFYLQMLEGKMYLFKGKDVPVKPLEKHQYFILYLPNERDSEFIYDCIWKAFGYRF